jgi:hypothetical protein
MSKKRRRGAGIEMKGPTDKPLVGGGKPVSATMPSLPTEIEADCLEDAEVFWRQVAESWLEALQNVLQSESSGMSEAWVKKATKALEKAKNGR